MQKIKKILLKIHEYDNIIILRHEKPDFDASGSQFGLKTWILDNYPNKKVVALGNNHKFFSPNLFPYVDEKAIAKPYLLIVVDTANKDRIEGKEYLENADYIIKIDHHPMGDKYAHLELLRTESSATAELLAEVLFADKTKAMSKEAAHYLYSGMVGDNGRFQYSSTNKNSFKYAMKLFATGINISDIYEKMYLKSIADIALSKMLYNNYKISPKGVIYYHVSNKDLLELNLEVENVKAFTNLFSNLKECPIWVAFTEDIERGIWAVSIRSRNIAINEVAKKFNGGGHLNAAGAKTSSYEETLKIIEELDKLI